MGIVKPIGAAYANTSDVLLKSRDCDGLEI